MTHQEQNDLLIEPRERKRGEKKERKETSCMNWQRTGQQGKPGEGAKDIEVDRRAKNRQEGVWVTFVGRWVGSRGREGGIGGENMGLRGGTAIDRTSSVGWAAMERMRRDDLGVGGFHFSGITSAP